MGRPAGSTRAWVVERDFGEVRKSRAILLRSGVIRRRSPLAETKRTVPLSRSAAAVDGRFDARAGRDRVRSGSGTYTRAYGTPSASRIATALPAVDATEFVRKASTRAARGAVTVRREANRFDFIQRGGRALDGRAGRSHLSSRVPCWTARNSWHRLHHALLGCSRVLARLGAGSTGSATCAAPASARAHPRSAPPATRSPYRRAAA